MIDRITRSDDPRLADYAHVGDHEWLRARGLFVAEGRLVVQRVLEMPRFRVESIAVTPAAAEGLEQVIAHVQAPVLVCSPDALSRVTGFNFHRGCLALVKRPAEQSPGDLTPARRVMALEGIGNPDNLGGLFRVAAAFAAGGVLLSGSCADPFYRKALRTSMGAVLRVPFARAADWRESVEQLRAGGSRIVAFTPSADAMRIDRFADSLKPADRLLLMFGAEGPGLTAESLQLADDIVRIPTSSAVDSLNVAVAAGIALAFLSSPDAA